MHAKPLVRLCEGDPGAEREPFVGSPGSRRVHDHQLNAAFFLRKTTSSQYEHPLNMGYTSGTMENRMSYK